jgi:signal recognition particle subunit SRP54
MFSNLSNSLSKVFDKLRGKGFISEEDVNHAMREIRVALLEADVALPVVKDFVNRIKEKAVGAELIKSITPGQLVVKIVHDELVGILGKHSKELNLAITPPAVIMLVGLQGSGKTTTCAKLALWLRQNSKKKVLMASLDTHRPAAQEQLSLLGKQIAIDVLEIIPEQKPLQITKRALEEAKHYDVLLLDSAGRLHTDEELINELKEIRSLSNPIEILLVADSLTGQDAVNIAKEFNEKIGISGIVLSRIDGDARGGAALSMSYITERPIKFIGVGEKPSDFEEFFADRIASRILDMGDVVSLVEKAAESINKEEAEKLANKIQKGQFDLNDLLKQFKTLRNMGGISKLATLIPGFNKFKDQISAGVNEGTLSKQEAIIYSMTKLERCNPSIINATRKRRIATGSGTKVEDVNRLLKQFLMMCKALKQLGKMSEQDYKKMERMLDGKR